MAELLLQTLPCRDQGTSCQIVSGNRSRRSKSSDGGQVARFRCINPVCTNVRTPDEILSVATLFEFEACVERNMDTASGTSAEENDPGIMRMSNWGAFSKEF
jgi:hypothetical protein